MQDFNLVFSNAHDTVSYEFLLSKLDHIGIRGIFLRVPKGFRKPLNTQFFDPLVSEQYAMQEWKIIQEYWMSLQKLNVNVKSWFRSPLTGRTQTEGINGINFSKLSKPSRVPQTSLLSILLFISYINCMRNSCRSPNCVHSADNNTLFLSGSTTDLVGDVLI